MNWWALKKLRELYCHQKTSLSKQFVEDNTIKYLISTGELEIDGKSVVVNSGSSYSFNDYYEKNHLKNFEKFRSLLVKHELEKPQSRYEEEELRILFDLDKRMVQGGNILEIRKQIIEQEESIRRVSAMFFFKDEKYLDNKEDVIEAFKKVLNIKQLANDKGQQWIYKLTNPNREVFVLCENLDFLWRTTKPLTNNIELWHAGGWNVPKLEREAPLLDCPIYYSCDWDHEGINIYLKIKEILSDIQLLTPNATPLKLADTPNHRSLWKDDDTSKIDELPDKVINEDQKKTIRALIEDEAWIREEDNDLISMLIINNALRK